MHTSTLYTTHNLGYLYRDQGKLVEAEHMYTRALEGYGNALGPKHSDTLRTARNLGRVYKKQGRFAKAEKLYASYPGAREFLKKINTGLSLQQQSKRSRPSVFRVPNDSTTDPDERCSYLPI